MNRIESLRKCHKSSHLCRNNQKIGFLPSIYTGRIFLRSGIRADAACLPSWLEWISTCVDSHWTCILALASRILTQVKEQDHLQFSKLSTPTCIFHLFNTSLPSCADQCSSYCVHHWHIYAAVLGWHYLLDAEL